MTRYLLGARNLSMTAFFGLLEQVSGRRAPRLRLPSQVERAGARLMTWAFKRAGRQAPLDLASVEMAQAYWYIDSTLARHALGFDPRPIRETLQDTIADIRHRGPS